MDEKHRAVIMEKYSTAENKDLSFTSFNYNRISLKIDGNGLLNGVLSAEIWVLSCPMAQGYTVHYYFDNSSLVFPPVEMPPT